jgi:hypothetical protein
MNYKKKSRLISNDVGEVDKLATIWNELESEVLAI